MARQSFESSAFDGDDDKPIDPTFLRVQARLRRLMLIGGGTLAIGIAAVFAAILYKIATYDSTARTEAAGSAAPSLSLAELGLPSDARLVSTALDANRLALTYQTSSGTETVFIEARTGSVLGRIKVGP